MSDNPFRDLPSVNDALRYVRSRADLYELQKNARLDPAGA